MYSNMEKYKLQRRLRRIDKLLFRLLLAVRHLRLTNVRSRANSDCVQPCSGGNSIEKEHQLVLACCDLRNQLRCLDCAHLHLLTLDCAHLHLLLWLLQGHFVHLA